MRFSKTPLRVSLFGGGTDNPNFFKQAKGSVTGFTINQFIWIFSSKIRVNQGFKYRLGYKTNEDVLSAQDIKHPLFREILLDHPNQPSSHFTTMSTLPSGAGLGSSSSFTVGLLALLEEGKSVQSKASLANEAIRYERDVLGESGGWQDQLHAAFGGINTFKFDNDGWKRKPVDMKQPNLQILSDSLYIVYTGMLRSASNIEKSKLTTKDNHSLLRDTYALALEGEKALSQDTLSLSEIGSLLNTGWELKRVLAQSVSSSHIDEIYKQILSTGAYGAKLCGAGGGGFFLVLAESDSAERLRAVIGKDKIMKVEIFYNGVETGSL